MAEYSVLCRVLTYCFVLATVIVISVVRNGSCITGCADTQEVYDIVFDFQGNCSMTVYWTTPDCPFEVTRYTVQSAQGCPSRWKSHDALTSGEHSYVIEDIALVTACLLGKCYIRVVADFDYSDRSGRILSHCVGLGDTFRIYGSPGATPKHNHYIGEQVCLPVRTTCPPSTLPNFFINQRMIALSTGGSEQDEFYLRFYNSILEICISNNNYETDQLLVVHEICHVNTKCHLCYEDFSELVLMTRTEVQIITTTNTCNESYPTEPEVDYLPSIVTFCSTSFTLIANDSWVEVCICLPLYELHSHDSEDIMVELSLQDNSTVSDLSSTTVILSPNQTFQCFNVDMPLTDIQYAANLSLEICLMLLGSAHTTKCIYVPEPCVEIIVTASNNTHGGDYDTTQEMSNNSATTTSRDINQSNNKLSMKGGVIAAIVLVLFTILIVMPVILGILGKKCQWLEGGYQHKNLQTTEENEVREIYQYTSLEDIHFDPTVADSCKVESNQKV